MTRGVVTARTESGFELRTSHGSYQIVVTDATSVTEKGQRGRVPIQVGDHVGVRGFVSGGQIRAIYVHIYPRKIKLKPYTIRGVISRVRGSQVAVTVGSASVNVTLTAQTVVRLGSRPSTAAAVTVGARVQVRVVHQGPSIVAIRIHVDHRDTGGKHLLVRGTVTALAPDSISVRYGSRTLTAGMPSSIRVYVGNKRSARSMVHVGARVTMYVCCQGSSLVATSIHVHTTSAVRHATTLLTGWVVSVVGGSIRLSTTRGMLEIAVVRSTRYTVGVTAARPEAVRAGDQISVRAAQVNGRWQAISVHVYSATRRPRTLTGTIVSVSPASLVILDRGRRYTVSLSAHPLIMLSGHVATAASLHPGDHVRVTGHLIGPASLSAARITTRRIAVKSQTVHGTVVGVAPGSATVVDSTGTRHQVRITAHTAIVLHRNPAPVALLFPGVHVSARGVVVHGTLVANRITLTLTARMVTARVTHVAGTYLVVQRGSTESRRIDLPGTGVTDNSKRVTVSAGAYVQAVGYEIHGGEIHATAVHVVHLSVVLTGSAVLDSGALDLETSQGERYRLRVTPATRISAGSQSIGLTASAIPAGAHLHVQGTVGADGRITVMQLTVRLSSVTLRGTVAAITPTSLSVTAVAGASDVRLTSEVTYAEGAHPMDRSGIVVGDDVTVYGYEGGHSVVLARKILVHRRIVGMDGDVASLTANGFILMAADGPHAVLLTGTTIFTGLTAATITPGSAIHVTGYRRGDGSILATRVRAGKHRTGRATPVPSPSPAILLAPNTWRR